jgi:uncharacterized membrane protein YczE
MMTFMEIAKIVPAGSRAPVTTSSVSLAARLAQLIAGLTLYGAGLSLLVLSGLGLDPWDVFHQGLARQTNLSIGTWTIIVGVAVLLLWIPLRLRPGIGTICNAVLIGVVMNAVLAVTPAPSAWVLRGLCLACGVVLVGVATGAYIGADLGPGPRDGLMVAIAARGPSIRVARTGIELSVLAVGYLLGGTVGIGTLVFAVCIGPLAHVTIPLFARRPAARPSKALLSEACT